VLQSGIVVDRLHVLGWLSDAARTRGYRERSVRCQRIDAFGSTASPDPGPRHAGSHRARSPWCAAPSQPLDGLDTGAILSTASQEGMT
jgi:hypothetical protein